MLALGGSALALSVDHLADRAVCAAAGGTCVDAGWRAGVYFEKYVKGKLGQTLWIRNLQLSLYGVPLAIVYSLLKDGRCAALGCCALGHALNCCLCNVCSK